jgi:hypothetical protein
MDEDVDLNTVSSNQVDTLGAIAVDCEHMTIQRNGSHLNQLRPQVHDIE